MNDKDNKRLGELLFLVAHGKKAVRDAALVDIYCLIDNILYSVGNTCYPTKEDIEDSIQNLMLSLLIKAKTYKVDDNACGWIMQIYRNTFRNFNKRKNLEADYFKKQVQILRDKHSEFNDYNEKYLLLNYVLGELDEYEYELYHWRYLYDYSIGEIATIFGKPKSTIQYQFDKLELKIKKLLEF